MSRNVRLAAQTGTPRRVWARGIDRLITSNRYVVMLGDIHAPSPEAVREALDMLTRAGPHTRVGIEPLRAERFWNYQPDRLIPVHEVPAGVAEQGIAATLDHVRHRPGPRQPLEVTVSDRHLAVQTDHGLGDVALMHSLFAALLALTSGTTTDFVTKPDTSWALPRALLHTFGRHPSRVRSAIESAKTLESVDGDASIDEGEPTPWTPSIAVSFAAPSAAAVAEVDAWRRAQPTPIGAGAAWMFIAHRALLTAGVSLSERAMAAFNCRRYLPDGLSVNSNFAIGLEIPLPSDGTPAELAQSFRTMTDSAFPLLALGAVSARALSPSATAGMTSPDHTRCNTQAKLTYSDLGRLSDLDDAPWRDGDAIQAFAGNVQPDSPHDISIFTAAVNGNRSLSFSFHDNVFDRSILDKAVDCMTNDPTSLLEQR